jgi:hypothetical protein
MDIISNCANIQDIVMKKNPEAKKRTGGRGTSKFWRASLNTSL